MTTVFDVARELISRNGDSLETVKLQKLCFYTFGWYAHLTGEPLFGEAFYAMPKGPVIGELLSAHAKQRTMEISAIRDQRHERGDDAEELDPYKKSVLDAVWDFYGSKSSWDLVDLTHKESVWEDAWESRRAESKRSDLSHEAIIQHFLERKPKADEKVDLPPAMISIVSPSDLLAIESGARVHMPFVETARSFRFAA